MTDVLIIKYGNLSTDRDGNIIYNKLVTDNLILEEEQTYRILFDYNKCVQIISLELGVSEVENDFLKSIDGKVVPMTYKGKSRNDNMDIFLISPVQINREIKIDMIL